MSGGGSVGLTDDKTPSIEGLAPEGLKILGVIHQADAGPGTFKRLCEEAGHELRIVNVAKGQRLADEKDDYDAAIVFGGSPQVDEEDKYPWIVAEKQFVRETIDRQVPLLGVCLGAQLIAEAAGAWVGPTQYARRGWNEVAVAPEAKGDPIFGGFGSQFTTVVWHGYEFRLPARAVPLASTSTSLQAFRLLDAPVWAVQFHPELVPETLAVWVELYKRNKPGKLTPEQIDEILSDPDRHRDEQAQVGRRILGGFASAVRDRRH